MSMNAIPRSARLSSGGEVVAILVASAAIWIALLGTVVTLFITVFIPTIEFGGKGEIPRDFPVYPGAHLQSAFATGIGDCTTVDATWGTGDSLALVAEFYQQELTRGPWTLVGNTRAQVDEIELYFRDVSGLHREGSLTVTSPSPSDKSTQISMTMYKSGAGADLTCRVAPTP
jgi:hypothetical protein